jgi:hypothetical protein
MRRLNSNDWMLKIETEKISEIREIRGVFIPVAVTTVETVWEDTHG